MFETEEQKIKIEVNDESYGRFVAEPLEPGFGTTLANALRRVLLSSIPGAAVTWVKIDGVEHEFSTIPFVKEDTVEFLLNVKEIRLRAFSDRPGRLMLDVHGEGRVCAGDIEPSADFEIANPELHLATLSSSEASLTVEFNVEHGKGYVPATYGDGLSIGVIPMDAIFTPVRKVNYTIKPTRVGQVTNYDSMILEVWTDGTITPLDALSRAAAILVQQFEPFRDLGKAPPPGAVPTTLAASLTREQYDIPIEQLTLSVRTFNCLRRANITKVGEILERSDADLLKIKNFGQKSLQEIHERLQSIGVLPPPEEPATEEAAGEVVEAPEAEAKAPEAVAEETLVAGDATPEPAEQVLQQGTEVPEGEIEPPQGGESDETPR